MDATRAGGGPAATVRQVTVGDWRLLREVRLRALADAPNSFGATLATARALTDGDWVERAGSGGLTLIAVSEGRPVAMGGARPVDVPSYGVWGMWTAPEARGQGLGGRILDTLVTWCRRESGAEDAGDVVLHVTEENAAARRLYVGRGFAPTGVWEPLRAGSSLRIEELRLDLRSGDPTGGGSTG